MVHATKRQFIALLRGAGPAWLIVQRQPAASKYLNIQQTSVLRARTSQRAHAWPTSINIEGG
jgi:hypothetical protein